MQQQDIPARFTPVRDDDWPVGKKNALFILVIPVMLGFFDFMDRMIIITIFPFLQEAYNLSDTQLGILASIVNFSVALLVVPGAFFIDRWSRKKMIVIMGVIWGLASGACVFATSFPQLLLARFFAGAGEAGYTPASQSLITASFPERVRSTAISIQQFGMSLGGACGMAFGAFIIMNWGWRHALGIVAIPGIVMACTALFLKDFKTPARQKAQTDSSRESYAKIMTGQLKTPTLLCVFLAQGSSMLCGMTLGNWLPTYLHRVADMSVASAGSYGSIYMLGCTFAMLLGGRLIDMLKQRGPLVPIKFQAVACLVAFGMLVAAFSLMTPGTVWQIGLVTLHTFLFMPLYCLGYTLTADLTPQNQRGTAISLLMLVQNIFGMAGPLLAGVLSDNFGISTSLLIMACFQAVAGGLYFMALRTYKADKARVQSIVVKF